MITPKEKSKGNIINLIGIALVFALLFILVEFKIIGSYFQGIIILACINIILATSLNITTGFLGQIALGHAGFLAIGAYSSALISMSLSSSGIPDILRFLIAILAGGILSAICGFFVGIPALRLRGDYLAIITLGFGEIIRVVILNLKITGGGKSLMGIDNLSNIYVVFWITVCVVAILFTFIRSKYGRAIMAIREDNIASEASGINNTYYKVLAFTVASFFAGIAGGIYAHYLTVLNASNYGFMKSTEYVVMVVLGGMGSLTGSILSAIILTILPEALRAFSEYRMLLYSIVLIIVMIFKPSGLLGTHEFSLIKIPVYIRSLKIYIKNKFSRKPKTPTVKDGVKL
ncbi:MULTISPECIES: branched-chain amino acid ABC transporter permease [Clostridium]|uniref:branched-chain amino acid ABC transporter permease n=1 Tax=Clostridium TaxID=1485 RepID=UPI0005EB850F|nr:MULTISPECIES: branched-chain amino acid ABC transporter permease [Clostridium]UZT07243.1 branched-chain amino acid ABC transporter permease [Clostridium sp. LQ25]